ncbi:hypothetical protein OESDEN_07843 [Oesophagostomum dentatum]|uniref:VWFA domain-containing protein n=1 Tax=Oesophagostomum dentatum TaxID=61180 RepID=A0A0B1T801_OESDE|nr:hypothetical protein OESDEN_07843 [Oesophagostomum dentatum]
MQYQHMDNALAFILSTLNQMTIGQEEQMTRAGFITFAKTAKMQYELNHFHSKEDATEGLEIDLDGTQGASIKA